MLTVSICFYYFQMQVSAPGSQTYGENEGLPLSSRNSQLGLGDRYTDRWIDGCDWTFLVLYAKCWEGFPGGSGGAGQAGFSEEVAFNQDLEG